MEIQSGPKEEHLLLADVIGAQAAGMELTVFAYPVAPKRRCWLSGCVAPRVVVV